MQAPMVLRPLCWGLPVAEWRRSSEAGPDDLSRRSVTRVPMSGRCHTYGGQPCRAGGSGRRGRPEFPGRTRHRQAAPQAALYAVALRPPHTKPADDCAASSRRRQSRSSERNRATPLCPPTSGDCADDWATTTKTSPHNDHSSYRQTSDTR
jgi:hypothetical protein